MTGKLTKAVIDWLEARRCVSPGVCNCPNMPRCPNCGYTEHDAGYHMDHHLCRGEIPAGRTALQATRSREQGGERPSLDGQPDFAALNTQAEQVGSVVGVLQGQASKGAAVLASGDETSPDIKDRPAVSVLTDVETSDHGDSISRCAGCGETDITPSVEALELSGELLCEECAVAVLEDNSQFGVGS